MKPEMRNIVRTGLDERIGPLLVAQKAALRPVKGWLRTVRSAVGLTQGYVAKRLHIQRQALAHLEKSEERGSISIRSLERAANAMDCDLVYFIVPRSSSAKSFAELAQQKDPGLRHLRASEHSMALEDQAIGDTATREGNPPQD